MTEASGGSIERENDQRVDDGEVNVGPFAVSELLNHSSANGIVATQVRALDHQHQHLKREDKGQSPTLQDNVTSGCTCRRNRVELRVISLLSHRSQLVTCCAARSDKCQWLTGNALDVSVDDTEATLVDRTTSRPMRLGVVQLGGGAGSHTLATVSYEQRPSSASLAAAHARTFAKYAGSAMSRRT